MNNRIYQNHLIRKRFGQNFLKDKFMIDSIVAAINPQKDQAIVEIGPGLAALTEPVVKYLNHLNVIELDLNLAKRLQTNPLFSSKLTVYQQDVMTMNFSKLSKKLGCPLRIFGNLPYNISTSLIFHLFKYIDVIVDMHLMLQKEVVNRLIAKPNSKVYGHLSIMAQYYCSIISVLEVPFHAFIPSPKVDSTLVRLLPHTKMPFLAKELHVLNQVTAKAFSQRRKIIRNSLRNVFTVKELIMLGIDPSMRAENLSIAQYCQMANYISDSNNMLRKEY